MKKTTLYNTHLNLNAKMTPFGGYEMPVQYSGVTKEHLAVRKGVGVFDVSHMGEFMVSGPKAFGLLQYICSNDISKISIGKAQYNYFPNETGGIVDDLIVYRLEEEKYLLVVNASNIEKDWKWVQKHNIDFGAVVEDQSEETALLAIQGPKAIEAMQQLTSAPLTELPYYSHTTATFAGCENTLIATTGYTGAGGLEIYLPSSKAPEVWDAIMKAGADFDILPAGLAARDTLRLEMGYYLYGNEINDTTSPLAAGLNWVTKLDTGTYNADHLINQKKEGTPEKLVGFVLKNRGIPRAGYSIVNQNSERIGAVTSGTQSPILSQGIGLGYVSSNYAKPGTQIAIQIRDKASLAEVVKLPFIKN
ncbi:glycine cleavage system aminomethyltransferase GcvT [Flavobacteriaceae bacterium]|nr:glycine cleavage system aminomethyltransferase GcvT [Flavobacteriaceae bacterium]